LWEARRNKSVEAQDHDVLCHHDLLLGLTNVPRGTFAQNFFLLHSRLKLSPARDVA
jgi:hypothetical protein